MEVKCLRFLSNTCLDALRIEEIKSKMENTSIFLKWFLSVDLDSQVSSGGLDQILTPAPSQPKMRSFYKSVSVTKVVRPDGVSDPV